MRFFLALLIVLVATPAEAARRKHTATVTAAPTGGCITSLPRERTGYWRYRLVNGRKCWFGPSGGRSRIIRRAQPRIEFYRWDEFNPIDAASPERIDDIQKRDFELRFKGTWDGVLEKIMPPYQK